MIGDDYVQNDCIRKFVTERCYGKSSVEDMYDSGTV